MIQLLMGYIYLALHRPMEIWPALEPFRIELVYFSLLCVAWLVASKRLSVQLPQLAIMMMGMAVYLSWMLSPWAVHGEIPVKNYTLVFVFGLILSTALRDERDVHKIIVAFLVVLTLYMLHSVWEYRNGRHTYRMGISRLIGVDGSLGDPNSFGATVIYALPFVRYLWLSWEPGIKRKMLVLYVLLSIGCIGLTGSRSSLVGLGVWALITIWLTGRRKVPLMGFGVLMFFAGFALLPDELKLRFTTIIDPSVGPENATESGKGRIEGFLIGLQLWGRFPLTGCGPGAWLPATKRAIESHNLVGQLVGELGTVGLIAFVTMIGSIFGWTRKLTRMIKETDPEPKAEPLYHLAQAIALSTFLLLFEGLFGHNLYRYNYVWYCAFVVVLVKSYRTREVAAPEEGWGDLVGVMDWLSTNVIWPLWARRDDPRFPGYVATIRHRQFDPPHVVAARQNVMLKRLLRHAAATVPHYRDLPVDEIQTTADLGRLPILTKAMIRERGNELLSSIPQPAITKKTSGSTGVPLRIQLDEQGLAWKRACTLVADEGSGWTRGRKIAKAWGNPEYRAFGIKGWLRNRLYERAIHLDTLKMSEAEVAAFAAKLVKFKPSLLFGHAHSVYLLAEQIHQHSLPACRPEGIITTAMVLHDFERRRIEQVFGCKVTNRYGCEEVSLIACECSAHRGLHVNSESLFVEIISGDRPAKPGEPGKVIVTDLSNFAMPLIRYQVGDMAAWSEADCPCGRGSRVLSHVEGREADYVVTASGHFVSGISLTENFATLVPGVAQIQIVQEAVDRFTFRIVRGTEFNAASELRIADLVRERFGPATRHTCEFVNSIPQEASGKYRFCISHVARAA